MEKTANQKWKESGSTLTFKDWIDRENKKKDGEIFLPFSSNSDSTNTDTVIEETLKDYDTKYKEVPDKSKTLGLDTTTVVFSSILILGSLTYYFFKRAKEKK